MVWKFCAVQIMRKYYCVLEAWYTQINGNQGGYTYKVLLLKYLATVLVCTDQRPKKNLTLKNLNSKNHLAHFTNSVMKIMALYMIGIGSYNKNLNIKSAKRFH